jgi:hypothetical protein
MSSRFAVPLGVLAVLVMVALGGVLGWFVARPPVAVAPPAPPPPVVEEPVEVAVDVIPPPRVVPPGPDAEFRAVIRLMESATINPDPRVAEVESAPLLDRVADTRDDFRRTLNTPETPADERARVDAMLKQLNTEEAKYRQRLARSSDAWLVAFAEAHTARTAEKTAALRRATKQTLRAFIKNPLREPNPAAADLAHMRRTQLEEVFHRAAGKDHGETSTLVTEIMQAHATAAERLEAIDDEEADAGEVHAKWRGELAERFAKNPGDVTPPEVAAWLASGCFPAAKATKPSGADFAFLDPARNPELVKATEKGPVRRVVTAWAAGHAKDPAAVAAAAALLKATKP